MDVSALSSSVTAAATGAPKLAAPEARARLQIAILKKALEGQREQVAELMKATEGKGQTIDIRA